MKHIPNILTDPIEPLLRGIAIPLSMSFLLSTLYNIVDTYFAKFVGTDALAGLTLSFPLFFIIIALGNGLATGATALISHELGAGKKEMAAHLSLQAILFGTLLSLLLAVLGFFATPWALSLMSGDLSVRAQAEAYLTIIFLGAPFFILQPLINAGVQARGDSRSLRNVMLYGVLLNILLDPLFLFGYAPLGIPAMGVKGIALATVLIQLFGSLYLLKKALDEEVFLGLTRHDWQLDIPRIVTIAHQGIPATLSMVTMALGVFVINYFLGLYSTSEALAAYGIAMRIEQLALLPALGISVALLTVVGQNAGAQNFARVREAYHTALRDGAIVMVVTLLIILPLATPLMAIFTTESTVIDLGRGYLYVEAVTFYAYILLFCSTSLLQGLKKPLFAIWIGLYRQIVAPLIFIMLFASLFQQGTYAVWWGICAATWSGAIVTLWYARKEIPKILS